MIDALFNAKAQRRKGAKSARRSGITSLSCTKEFEGIALRLCRKAIPSNSFVQDKLVMPLLLALFAPLRLCAFALNKASLDKASITCITTLLLLAALLFGCHAPALQKRQEQFKSWIEPNGKLKVLSTIAMIDDLVKRIGGEHVDSLVLIKGQLDPHSYQLVKGDDEKLSFADIIFYNGLGLEHGPSLQQYLQQSSKAKALGDAVAAENSDKILTYQNQADPHIWMDMSLWAKIVPHIIATLSDADPKNGESYRQKGQAVYQELIKEHEHLKAMMHSVPQEDRYLVTSHDAFNYFAKAYMAEERELTNDEWQKRFAAPEGLAPESQLSSADIQTIIDHLAKWNIRVLFTESNLSKDSIRKIVEAGRQKGLELTIARPHLYGDAMGEEGSDGDSYIKMVRHNVKTISENLRGCSKTSNAHI